MLDTSTAGRGLPKSRSINVEANLLTERNQELAGLQLQLSRKVGRLVLILAVGGGLTMGSFLWLQEATDKRHAALRLSTEVSTQLSALRDLKAKTEPAMKQEDMRQLVNARADTYLTLLQRFFANTRPNMVLQGVKAELVAGDMRLNIRGVAEDYSAYLTFVQRLQKTAGERNVVPRSTRRSTDLGPESMVFEVVQIQSVKQQ